MSMNRTLKKLRASEAEGNRSEGGNRLRARAGMELVSMRFGSHGKEGGISIDLDSENEDGSSDSVEDADQFDEDGDIDTT